MPLGASKKTKAIRDRIDKVYGTLKTDRPVDALIDEMRGPRPALRPPRRSLKR
jgi:hypothetical protein